MSWGALPWWVYDLEYEHRLCEWTCCFPEEYWAGFTRSTPEHVVVMRKRNEDEEDLSSGCGD